MCGKAVESKDFWMPSCPEQFNSTKIEMDSQVLNDFESNDEKSSVGKIMVESKDLWMPTCPEQFDMAEVNTDGKDIDTFGNFELEKTSAVENKDILEKMGHEQFNLVKSGLGEENNFESIDKESAGRQITIDSKNLLMPVFPEQSSISEVERDENAIFVAEVIDTKTDETVDEPQKSKKKKRKETSKISREQQSI